MVTIPPNIGIMLISLADSSRKYRNSCVYPAIPDSSLLVGVIMMKRRDPGAKPDRTCWAGKYGTILAVIAVFICFALIFPVAAESADGGTILPVELNEHYQTA